MFEEENSVKLNDVIVTKQKIVPKMIVLSIEHPFCSACDVDGVVYYLNLSDVIVIGSI